MNEEDTVLGHFPVADRYPTARTCRAGFDRRYHFPATMSSCEQPSLSAGPC